MASNSQVVSLSPREAKSGFYGRNLEAGTIAERGEDAAYVLAPHGSHSLLSYTTEDHLSKGGTTHSGLGHPTSIINQENSV